MLSHIQQKLRTHLDVSTVDDPTKRCIYSEHLSRHNEPWDVSKHVVQIMQSILMWTTSNKERDDNITDDVYRSVIAR